MTRILVPLDADGDRTMRQVEALRDLPLETDAEVLLLHVYDPIDAHGTGVAGTSIDEINAAMERLHGLPDELPEADEQLQGAGYSTRLITAVDEVDTAILSVAEAETVDLIVLATRKQSPVGKALFGSVAQSVILDASVPVLVI
jgi:Universal stress protein UspA and related nucleotide-binding proteins